jgi:polyprenyldihydroxybenzoate methyltransferase/3-demethylubiquinol 3-O-methyltransferase
MVVAGIPVVGDSTSPATTTYAKVQATSPKTYKMRPNALLSLPAPLRRLLVTQSSLRAAVNTSNSIRAHSTDSTSNASKTFNTTNDFNNGLPGSSVNATEVSHFNTLASSWWDPHGSSRLLHLMNQHRHPFINRCLSTAPPLAPGLKRKYLDIGCGGGIFAESAARLSTTHSVTAVDPTPEVIAVAKRHQRTDPLLMEPGRLTYHNIPVEALPLPKTPSEGFDIVSLFEVIEHIQQPAPFLRSILQHLKPGGWFIGSTIARTGTSWFTTKFMAEEVLRMVPRGTHDWNQYIQPYEMKAWADKQPDLESWKVMGVVYVPGFGWKEVQGSEGYGNYFFGVRKKPLVE